MNKLISVLLLLPMILQGSAMYFDEFYFHRKRGLPKWERIGHPIDTFFVLVAISVPIFFHFQVSILIVYVILSIFSSILVTKDEFVHSEHCEPKENWLHGLLFILHPMIFLALGLIWFQRDTLLLSQYLEPLPDTHTLQNFLFIQFGVIIVFFSYQILYWNFIYTESKEQTYE